MNQKNIAGASFCLTNLELERNRAQAQTNEVLRRMYNRIADLWMKKLQASLKQS